VFGGGEINTANDTASDVTTIAAAASPTPPAPAPGTNIALGKSTAQSSSYFLTTGPEKAVDGNTDGNYYDGSITHTLLDTNTWWQVDLGAPTAIGSVVIWNRTDCCGDRLSDYWVFISNTPFGAADTPATLQARAGTWSSHQTSAPSPSTTITVPSIQGQYVRIQLSGANYLSLAEVQVMAPAGQTSTQPPPILQPPAGQQPTSPARNLALAKSASQSSVISYTAVPYKAVDGNTDGNFDDGSVTQTSLNANAWWQVDLGASSTVTSIVIWNRTDCCGDRLSDYWVFLSDTPFGVMDTPATLQSRAGTWSSHQTVAPHPSATITVPSAAGRYVRVQLSGTNYLSLAEVQVMGTTGN
jgi:hypothetical protein